MDRLIIISILLATEVNGYCHPEDPACSLLCHCTVDSECNDQTGCTSGCDTDVLGVPWRGTHCNIGNVALYKTANQTGSTWPASGGTDGDFTGTESNVCAHPNALGTQAKWGVRLGGLHQIYNITIHNRRTCCRDRLTQFTIKVRNSSLDEELCYDDNSTTGTDPGTIVQLSCEIPLIGSYVEFARKPGSYQENSANFCEFIVIGEVHIDCGQITCPQGVDCNNVVGCEECNGAYQPECTRVCSGGFYGINCLQRCGGHCAGSQACDAVNGGCPNGCEVWWTETKCDRFIPKVIHYNETARILNVSGSSIEISWTPLTTVPEDLWQFYGYTVFYKESSSLVYLRGPDVIHSSTTRTMIRDLVYNTMYDLRIDPYRTMSGIKEYNSSYPVVSSSTACVEPAKPTILSVYSRPDGNENNMLTVVFSSVVLVDPRCESITNAWIQYKLSTDAAFAWIEIGTTMNTSFSFLVGDGDYKVRLTVVNNAGLKSDSPVFSVFSGKQQSPAPSQSPTTSSSGEETRIMNIPAVAIPLAIVAAAVIIVVPISVVISRRRKRQKDRKDVQMNSTNEAFNSSMASIPNTPPPGVNRTHAIDDQTTSTPDQTISMYTRLKNRLTLDITEQESREATDDLYDDIQ